MSKVFTAAERVPGRTAQAAPAACSSVTVVALEVHRNQEKYEV